MKTTRLMFVTLFVAASVSSPMVWAGEPNPDAFTSGSKTEKSQPTPGRDCGPEASQEVSAPTASILLE
ncbi:MAG TPA: hypothetical protein VM715_09205 [Candidatus Acidoferrum sp.]|nr:hypothetical protein [Candidatus Acidoferrum sp.]